MGVPERGDGQESLLVVGVSACLLGRPVRYDGGHKHDRFVTDTLGPFVRFVPVCPEVELGLGTPRETLRLVDVDGDVRMVMADGQDYTDAMREYAAARVAALADEDLDGYILKKDSPSCGVHGVKLHGEGAPPRRTGRGLFAEALIERFPSLPVEEEGRLADPQVRENFVERLFAYRRVKTLFSSRWTVGDVVAFHTAHKFALLAHSTVGYRALGRLVAGARDVDRATLCRRYTAQFMDVLSALATPKKHANVLMHMLGHLRGRADAASRDALVACIDEYRRGLVPLVMPVTLLRNHVRRLGIAYLAGQAYLDPHPKELALRNRV